MIEGRDIVGLEHPKRYDVAPRIEDDEVTHEGLRPCL